MNVEGVNVVGFIKGEFGLGQGAIMTIKALEAAGIPVNIINHDIKIKQRSMDSTITNISTEGHYPINIIQVNPDNLKTFLISHKDFLKNKYNIAFWVWELQKYPKEWIPYFNFFDEVWTQSSFCATSMSTVSNIPISVYSCPVMPNDSRIGRNELGLPEDKFIFLTVFDFCSSIIRKNIMGVIDAFERAFKNDSSVLLVIKTIASEAHIKDKQHLENRIIDLSNVQLLHTTLSRDEYNGLIKSCDTLVSLHRAEGFGLTMFEAMSEGKPVIATDFSGNRDFMNSSNSFLVPYTMTEVVDTNTLYQRGNYWAEPDTDEAARLMKSVKADYARAKQLAANGQHALNTNYSLLQVGERMKERLELIYEQHWMDKTGTSLRHQMSLLQNELDRCRAKNKYLEKTIFNKIRSKIRKTLHPERYKKLQELE